jgi:hypothetical protein
MLERSRISTQKLKIFLWANTPRQCQTNTYLTQQHICSTFLLTQAIKHTVPPPSACVLLRIHPAMPAVATKIAIPSREIRPPSYSQWVSDGFSQLENMYTEWVASLAKIEELAQKRIYDADDTTDFDLRMHRMLLYGVLQEGEVIALGIESYMAENEDDAVQAPDYLNLVDKKLESVRHILHKWHCPVDVQDGIPESFFEGLRDFKEGRTTDMEVALTQPPPGA